MTLAKSGISPRCARQVNFLKIIEHSNQKATILGAVQLYKCPSGIIGRLALLHSKGGSFCGGQVSTIQVDEIARGVLSEVRFDQAKNQFNRL